MNIIILRYEINANINTQKNATMRTTNVTMTIEDVKVLMTSNISKQRKVNALKSANFSIADINNLFFFYSNFKPELTENDLTFGVEIETLAPSRDMLAMYMHAKCILAKSEYYNHNDNDTYYKVVSDGSVKDVNDTSVHSAEIVSPILKGVAGMQSLKKVCDAISDQTRVNKTCGLHVHIGVEHYKIENWHNLYINTYRLEKIIDGFMPKSRHDNLYCKKMNGNYIFSDYESQIKACRNTNDISRVFRSDRYFKINPESFARHSTIEFRQHSGTTDFEKISMWVSFLRKLVLFSQKSLVENVYCVNDIPFLNESEKAFFTTRTNKLTRLQTA